jgi:hypothetical protein
VLIVRVELRSAVTGRVTEIARMRIVNRGTGTAGCGDYDVMSFCGRDRAALDRGVVQRRAEVLRWPRLRMHVWSLVAEALAAMGYSRMPQAGSSRTAAGEGQVPAPEEPPAVPDVGGRDRAKAAGGPA